MLRRHFLASLVGGVLTAVAVRRTPVLPAPQPIVETMPPHADAVAERGTREWRRAIHARQRWTMHQLGFPDDPEAERRFLEWRRRALEAKRAARAHRP